MTDTQLALFFDYSAKSPPPLQLGVGLFVAPHMKHEVEFELHGSAECGARCHIPHSRVAYAPLRASCGARHKVHLPLAGKLAVGEDFLCCNHHIMSCHSCIIL